MKNVSKKLALKAELLRHLDTVEKRLEQNKPSSALWFILLHVDLGLVDLGVEPDMTRYDGLLKE